MSSIAWKTQTWLKLLVSDCLKKKQSRLADRPSFKLLCQGQTRFKMTALPALTPAQTFTVCVLLVFSDQNVPAVFPAKGLEFAGRE